MRRFFKAETSGRATLTDFPERETMDEARADGRERIKTLSEFEAEYTGFQVYEYEQDDTGNVRKLKRC